MVPDDPNEFLCTNFILHLARESYFFRLCSLGKFTLGGI